MSMLSLANFVSSGMLGGYEKFQGDKTYGWVYDLCAALNNILAPLLIIVATAGMIYAVVLGVNLARADSADKQQEAKKRLIYAIVGLVVIIVLIILLKLFVAYSDQLIGIDIDHTNSGDETGMFLPFV